MENGDLRYEAPRPGLIVVFVAVILGSGIALLLSTHLLGLSPAWLAFLVGAAGSILGFFVRGESIGDAIVFSIIFLVLVFVFLTAGPEIEIVRLNIVPVATGICVGKLTYGIWKEII